MFIDVGSFVQHICGVFQIPKQLHKMSKKLIWGHFQSGKRKRCVSKPLSYETQMLALTNCERDCHEKTKKERRKQLVGVTVQTALPFPYAPQIPLPRPLLLVLLCSCSKS